MATCTCLHELENNLPRTKLCLVPCAAQCQIERDQPPVIQPGISDVPSSSMYDSELVQRITESSRENLQRIVEVLNAKIHNTDPTSEENLEKRANDFDRKFEAHNEAMKERKVELTIKVSSVRRILGMFGLAEHYVERIMKDINEQANKERDGND